MCKTRLNDRELYYDGDTVVTPDRIASLLKSGQHNVCVSELTEEIKQFNRFVAKADQIKVKNSSRPLSFEWNIPDTYKTLDVTEYVLEQLANQREFLHDAQFHTRALRVEQELDLYERLELIPVLRTIIYIINTLQEKNIVWGVGRGSSVSSYVLYLVGAHDVDSVKYDLEISDFLRVS